MSEAEIEAQNDDGEESRPKRTARRFVPVEPVSVALFTENELLGHGVVSNISESGACLITSTLIEPQEHIRVTFKARSHDHLFQSRARVVWSGEGMDPNLEIVGVMVGIAFLDCSPTQREKVAEILEQDWFHEIAPPEAEKQPSHAPATG